MRGGRTNYDLGGFGIVLALAVGAPLLVGGLIVAILEFLIPIAIIVLVIFIVIGIIENINSSTTVKIEKSSKPKPQYWICSKCHCSNLKDLYHCEKCGAAKPTNTAHTTEHIKNVHKEDNQAEVVSSKNNATPNIIVNIDKPPQSNNTSSDPASPLKDINTITYQELLQFSGIGKDLANKVISFRNTNGKINNIDSLSQVNGIGQSKLRLLKKYLYVTNDSSTGKGMKNKLCK